MDTENIKELAAALEAIGFKNGVPALLQKICFHPKKFTLQQSLLKGADRLLLVCCFEKIAAQPGYQFCYYEVSLAHELQVGSKEINGVQLSALEEDLQTIDFKKIIAGPDGRKVDLEDKSTWEEEAAIESVVFRLAELEKTEEGKRAALVLRQKYWAVVTLPVLALSGSPVKGKSAYSQRFFVQPGQGLISLDEAYRFLQNKRWEHKVSAGAEKRSAEKSGAAHGNLEKVVGGTTRKSSKAKGKDRSR